MYQRAFDSNTYYYILQLKYYSYSYCQLVSIYWWIVMKSNWTSVCVYHTDINYLEIMQVTQLCMVHIIQILCNCQVVITVTINSINSGDDQLWVVWMISFNSTQPTTALIIIIVLYRSYQRIVKSQITVYWIIILHLHCYIIPGII